MGGLRTYPCGTVLAMPASIWPHHVRGAQGSHLVHAVLSGIPTSLPAHAPLTAAALIQPQRFITISILELIPDFLVSSFVE